MRVLLAGSTGVIGKEIEKALRSEGHELICPTRAEGFEGRCRGVDIVISAMGGSVAISAKERRPYAITNTETNRVLLYEAKSSRVRRMLYIAAHTQPGYAHTAYIRSHEAFVDKLKRSGLGYSILRPTAIFNALAPFVDFARKGVIPLIGDGSAKTNPIAASDVARAAVEFLQDGPKDISLGGPEIFTRREIAELAAAAVGRRPFYFSAPAAIANMNGRIAGIFNPRLGELIQFAAAVCTHDCIAPFYGKESLSDFFRNGTYAEQKRVN